MSSKAAQLKLSVFHKAFIILLFTFYFITDTFYPKGISVEEYNTLFINIVNIAAAISLFFIPDIRKNFKWIDLKKSYLFEATEKLIVF